MQRFAFPYLSPRAGSQLHPNSGMQEKLCFASGKVLNEEEEWRWWGPTSDSAAQQCLI